MQPPVEIRYAGIVVGRAQEVRNGDDGTFFLPGKDPMPVGTVVQLRSGDKETPARVLRAVESSDPAAAGMKVNLIGEAETVLPDWIPAPAVIPTRTGAKTGTPTPSVEVDLGLMQTEMPKAPAVLDAAKMPIAVEDAAIPEAVPVTVGSSLSAAIEKAAEASPVAAPATQTEAPPAVTNSATEHQGGNGAELSAAAPAPAPETAPDTAAAQAPDRGAGDSQGAGEGATDPMPVARPIAGPSGRRKTKRRRS